MPEIGEIKEWKELGYKTRGQKYIWFPCKTCGKERWVAIRGGKPKAKRCPHCSYESRDEVNSNQKGDNWKGGRSRNSQGYILILLQPDDFFYPMTLASRKRGRYVSEHRLVMAKHLGRNLHSWEIVHHKNHIRDDNRRENLQLVSDDRHKQITILESKITYLEKANRELAQRMTLLEAELTLLRTQQEVKNGT